MFFLILKVKNSPTDKLVVSYRQKGSQSVGKQEFLTD